MRTGSSLVSSLPAVIAIVLFIVERCMFARSLSPVDRTNQKGAMSSFANGLLDLSGFGADAAEKVTMCALPPNSFIGMLS